MGPQFYFERSRTLTDWSLSHQESPVFIFFNVFVQMSVLLRIYIKSILCFLMIDGLICLHFFYLKNKLIECLDRSNLISIGNQMFSFRFLCKQ